MKQKDSFEKEIFDFTTPKWVEELENNKKLFGHKITATTIAVTFVLGIGIFASLPTIINYFSAQPSEAFSSTNPNLPPSDGGTPIPWDKAPWGTGPSDVDPNLGEEFKIADSGTDPRIHNSIVVYENEMNPSSDKYPDIHMKNLITNEVTKITHDDQTWDRDPVIYGKYVAWVSSEMENGLAKQQDIVLYNIQTGQTTNLTHDDINVARNNSPAIYANKVVWVRYHSGNNDFYAQLIVSDIYSGVSYVVKQSVDEYENYIQPDIFRDIVVWVESVEPFSGYNISMIDLTSGIETNITYNSYAQIYPRIYYPWVAWEDWQPVNGLPDKPRIFAYNIKTGEEVNLVDFAIDHGSAREPAIYQNKVVFYGNETGGALSGNDIFLHPIFLTNDENIKVTIADNQQKSPDIWGKYIVWEDWRTGMPEIYGFKLN